MSLVKHTYGKGSASACPGRSCAPTGPTPVGQACCVPRGRIECAVGLD